MTRIVLLLGGVLEDEGDIGGGQEDVSDFETWLLEGFTLPQKRYISFALELGPDFVTYNTVIRCESLYILSRRLAYPCRYTDTVQQRFGRSKAVMHVLLNHMLN